MTSITILRAGEVVEVLSIRTPPERFIVYRGKLLEKVSNPANGAQHLYEERTYLEIY